MSIDPPSPSKTHLPVVTKGRGRLALRIFLISLCCVVVFLVVLGALIVWKPLRVLDVVAKRVAPGSKFTAKALLWTSSHSVVIEDAQFGDALKVAKIHISWDWTSLRKKRFKMLSLEGAELYVDITRLDELFGKGGSTEPATGLPWRLDKLEVQRSGLLMIGLGSEVPPLAIEIAGEWEDVMIGGKASKADLEKKRKIILRQIHLHSPLDLAVTLLKINHVVINFDLMGLQKHSLDSLVISQPVLEVDRGLFWFMDALQRAHEARPKKPAVGPKWMVKNFHIEEGALDITRLEALYFEYPFGFEVTRNDMELSDLSLANFQIELDIPEQNIFWAAPQVSFQGVYGKIEFGKGSAKVVVEQGQVKTQKSHDMVNTLYVNTIHWKETEIKEGWLSLSFDEKSINGTFGGAFADGYLNGGSTFGWTLAEKWYLWGSAADVDTGKISSTFNSDTFAMNGRAALNFKVEGLDSSMIGDLQLNSLSSGLIELRSLDKVLKKIEESTTGIKRETLEIFVSNLRNYPYDKYLLNLKYSKPDAVLHFQSDSKVGFRKLDVNWHGLENTKIKPKSL
jgi:hypothetical protein